MLFTNITDCELLVFRCIQLAKREVSLVQILDVLETRYRKKWKRSTVCTFISHLVDKGYVASRREGRVFYYSCIVDEVAFKEEQTKQFMEFWFDGSVADMIAAAGRSKGIDSEQLKAICTRIEER